MALAQTIQSDFNKMFRLQNIEYPYSLKDMLQLHTGSTKQDEINMYLQSALHSCFENSSMYMSDYEEDSKSAAYNMADIYIFTKKNMNKDPLKEKIVTSVKNKSNSLYQLLSENKKYIIVARKKAAYDILKRKVIDNPGTETATRFIVCKVIFQDTLVFVLYDIDKQQIDILYSSTLKGERIENIKTFQRRLMVNIQTIFNDEQFGSNICSIYYFGHYVTNGKDDLHSYIWFALTLKYFSPTIDIGKLKDYIVELPLAQRHNMIINWANFMIKYAKHLTNIEFDTFLISELVHSKTKKKITKKSPTKRSSTQNQHQNGGGIRKRTKKEKQKVTSYIRQLFRIV